MHDDLPPRLRVLLVDDGAGRANALRDALARLDCDVVGVLDSPLLIHDCVQRLRPDVVIVDSDSPSRDTLENLSALSARMPRPVVVFTDDPNRALMQRALAAGVSAYVVAGMQPQRLAAVLNVAIARFEQEAALKTELAHAKEQLAARKRIEQAKGILMASRGLDENAAYAQLRRLAMDRKVKLVEIADRIIEAKSLLS
ncbi:MAG: ANTAR domain-containing response regulator [Pseudomonadota bacterium]